MLGWSIHSLSGQLLWRGRWGLRLRMRSVMWWWSLRQRHQPPGVPSWIKEREYAKCCICFIFSTAEVGGWDMMAQSILDFFWPAISPHGTQCTKPSLLEILTLLGKVANGVKRMEYVSSFFRKPLTLRLAKRGTGILGSWCRAVSKKQTKQTDVLTKLQDAELGRSTVKRS